MKSLLKNLGLILMIIGAAILVGVFSPEVQQLTTTVF